MFDFSWDTGTDCDAWHESAHTLKNKINLLSFEFSSHRFHCSQPRRSLSCLLYANVDQLHSEKIDQPRMLSGLPMYIA